MSAILLTFLLGVGQAILPVLGAAKSGQAGLPVLGVAESGQAGLPVLQEEIVVTPERGAVQRDEVAASVTVLTREQLEKLPAQSLAEVVNTIPGFAMSFASAAAGAPMVSARGFFGGGENEYVQLLIDGVPAGDVESGLIDWRHIRVADIERIEVLRGPGSSLYGDSAMGGVIQVFTRGAGVSPARGELRLSSGSNATRAADVVFRADVGSFILGVNGLMATTGGYRAHSASRDSGGDVTLQRIRDESRLRATGSFSSKDREEAGPLTAAEAAKDRRGSNAAFRQDREHTQRHRLSLGYETFGTTSMRTMLHAADRTTEFPRTLLLAPGFGSTLFRHLRTRGFGGTFEIARGGLRAGTDLDRDSLHENYTVPGSAADAHRNRAALFVTGDRQLSHVRLSAGLRRDDIRDEYAGSHRKSAWSPRLGATLHLGDASAFVQVSGSFKAPTLDQLFDPRPFPGPGGTTFTVSNPSLLPQRARNVEVGLSRATSRAAWSVGAYRMHVTDEIDFDPTFFLYKNIGSSRHTGVEAAAELRQMIVQPLVTYAWTRVRSTDKQLKNIPEHAAHILLRTTLPGAIGASLGGRWEHNRFADDDERFRLPDVRTIDARLDRTLGPLRVELDMLNLLDAKYSYVGSILNDFRGRPTQLEFPAPGREVRVTMAWRY
jgi:vitamin B12 transporter